MTNVTKGEVCDYTIYVLNTEAIHQVELLDYS